MSEENQVDTLLHKKRDGKRIVLSEGKAPQLKRPPIGRLHRITRYMALAIYYEDLIRKGHVHDYAEIAILGHVTRARVTQIMNLRLLAPDIQEELITLDRVIKGRDSLSLRHMQSIALDPSWINQRNYWTSLDLA
ncbi:MAG: hypothetical protein ACOVQM_10280 [Pirellula sp.]|jgi:hypothetical protein